MTSAAKRVLSVFLLVSWVVPSAGALSLGVHLVLDHHGRHQGEHWRKLAELSHTAAHGHHHDSEAASDHDHHPDARIERPAAVARPGATLAVLLTAAVRVAAITGRSSPAGSPGDEPPVPLFRVHCSLLL